MRCFSVYTFFFPCRALLHLIHPTPFPPSPLSLSVGVYLREDIGCQSQIASCDRLPSQAPRASGGERGGRRREERKQGKERRGGRQ